MEDIILISSDEDSDVERKTSSSLKTEYSTYSPELNNHKDRRWTYSQRICSGEGPSPPVPALGNLGDGKQLGSNMGSQSPKQGLAFPEGVERMSGYTFTLQNNPQFSWQSPGNSLSEKDQTTPGLLCANNRCPGKTWITKRTEGCENDVRWRHLWKSHDLFDRSYIEPSSVISSQSQFPSDLHDKNDFTTDSLNTMVNASYITGHPPSPHMSSLSQQGSSMEVGLKKAGKVESVAEHKPLELERNCEESGGNSFQNDASAASPVSSYGSYYCPSERDPVDLNSYSMCETLLDSISTDSHSSSPTGPGQCQGSLLVGSLAHTSGSCESKAGGTNEPLSQFPSVTQSVAGSDSQTLVDTGVGLGFGLAPSPSMPHVTGPSSPTSTDILAGDSPDWVADDAELPSDSSVSDNKPSPISDPSTVTFRAISEVQLDRDANPDRHVPSFIQNAGKEMEREVGEESDHESGLGCTHQDRRYVSKAQLRRLKLSSRRPPQDQTLVDFDDDDEKEEDFGPREQLCRQSLSLVNSTIEENYPEGTLQLLSDFLHPRFYPPFEVMNYLIRGILLDTQCPITLVTEAYNLLMRIQKYHPADQSTFQWDWELLTSVLGTQDNSRKHRSTVQRMLLQYILQTLEDDFWANLDTLQHSIVRAMLSCDRKFSNVRDVIGWLVCAVKNSTVDPAASEAETDEEKMDRDENLQMVFLLQKVLTLVVEVDRSPTLSSNKLSRELFQTLISTEPLRQHRMLLLETIENKLLRCKILELLLEHTCQQKTNLPMSLSLILHFVHYSQPMDGAETQPKWGDLIQLLWMLLLSYEEVKEGHLRLSISDRYRHNRIPIQTLHDQITREAVQEVADAFLSRASAELGCSLPPQLQELFSYLKDNLLEACQH